MVSGIYVIVNKINRMMHEPWSKERKTKLSEFKIKYYQEHPMSKETRQKMSEAKIEYHRKMREKKIEK